MEVVKEKSLKERVLKIQSQLPRRGYSALVIKWLNDNGHEKLAKQHNIQNVIWNVVNLRQENQTITEALEAVANK
jgi:hypothetical protein